MILRVIKLLFILMALLLVLALIFNFWLQTGTAKKMVADMISDSVKKETGYDIELENLSIFLPVRVACEKVSLKDEQNKLLEVDNFSFDIVPSLFFFQEILVENISAKKVILSKDIASQDNKIQKDNTKSNNIYLIPDITIKSFAIDEIRIVDFMTNQLDSAEPEQGELALNLKANIKIYNHATKIQASAITELLHPATEYLKGSKLSAIINYDIKNQLLNIDNLALNSPAIEATGSFNADLTNDQLGGNIKYASGILQKELKKNFAKSSGEVEGIVDISGKFDHIILKTNGLIKAEVPEVDFYKFPDLKWQTLTNIANGKVWGSASMQQANFNITGDFAYNNQLLSLNNFVAKSKISTKRSSMKYDLKSDRIEANVVFVTDDLKDLQAYFPFAYNGSANIDGKYVIEDAGKKINVDMKASLKNVESGYFRVSVLDAKLKSSNLLKYKINEAEILLQKLVKDNLLLESGSINAQQANEGIAINTKVKGQMRGGDSYNAYPADISILKNIKITEKEVLLDIENIEGKLGGAKLSMSKLAKIQLFLKNDEIMRANLDFPELAVDQGKISISGMMDHKKMNVNSTFDNITKSIFPNFLTNEFNQAIFNGQMTLTGDALSPQLNSNLIISDVIITNKKTPTELLINSEISKNKMSIALDINDRSSDNNNVRSLANVTTTVPILFQLSPFVFELYRDKAFALDYVTKDKFNVLSLIRLPLGHKISGILEGNLSVRGTLNNPNMQGNLVLSDGKYSYKTIGVKTKDINGEITASGNKIFLKNIRIGDYFDKFIEGTGQISIAGNFPYKLSCKTEEFNLLNSPYTQGVVSGNFDIDGNRDRASAKGKVIIGPMEIKIPERFNKSYPSLNVVEVIEEDDGNNIGKENIKPFDLALDVTVQTNDKVFVRGWGVNTRLEGALRIVGTSDNPEITGRLAAVKGKFNEFGKQLEITKGKLIFDGPVPPSPYLNIIGTYKDEAHEISLVLGGTILEPTINISSIPDLPEEAALSILLFGNDPENISAFQAYQLASSMRKLSGKGGGGIDPLDAGKKAIGLDEVYIKQDSRNSEETSIGVGKYLSDKFYIELEQGFSEGTKTKIEVELSPKINLEGSTDSSGESNVGINWKFDY